MRAPHCICVLMLLLAAPALAQAPAAEPTTTGFMLFVQGQPVGHETVTVRSGTTGITISSAGRVSVPVDVTLRHAEVRYAPDWTPISLALDASVQGGTVSFETTFADGRAISTGTQLGQPLSKTDAVSARPIVLANGFWGAYAAIARRLAGPGAPTELRAYITPTAEFGLRVASTTDERMQIGTTTLNVRRHELVVANPGGDVTLHVTAADDGALIRVSIPAQGIDLVRDDLASSTSRTQVYSNPGDEAVVIPAAGFNIGATLTRPAASATSTRSADSRLPVVVLHGDAGVFDRDGAVAGIPVLGQLAGALADAGYLVVRYDKRGYGQSGGRSESATISDVAEDLRAVVKWVSRRDDVDRDRIAVLGHGEGAWVALLAASREDRVAAVVTVAAPATTAAELILEQQRHAFDLANMPDAERAAKVALQKRIMTAAVEGEGWDEVPLSLRGEADTPWFQSLLEFELAEVVEDVDQPLLIVHGDLDRQVPVAHADELAALAHARDEKQTEVVIARGINHLVVPATTGEVGEYASLTDRHVSPDVTTAIVAWLARSIPAR